MALPTFDPAPDPRDLVLARRVTRRGIFERIDPARPGTVWNRWRWAGLAFWVAVVGASLAEAWRQHGGLPGRDPAQRL